MLGPKQLAKEIRGRREEREVTQRELGVRIGCSQAAISQVEQGDLSVISRDKLNLLLKELDLPVDFTGEEEEPQVVLAACPNPKCPAALPRSATRGLYVRPKFFLIPAGDTRFCDACGTPLMDQCPTPGCGEPLQDGAIYCTACGDAYAVLPRDGSGSDLVELKRLLIEQHREFIHLAPPPHRLPARKKTRVQVGKPTSRGLSANE